MPQLSQKDQPEWQPVILEIYKLMDKYDLGDVQIIRTDRTANVHVNFRTCRQVEQDISSLAIEMEEVMEDDPQMKKMPNGKWRLIDPLDAESIGD